VKKLRSVLCALAIAVAACSGDAEGRFSAEEAQAVAKRFHEAMANGDVPAASQLARAPFRYKDPKRVWPDQTTVEKNLAKEIPRVKHLLGGLNRIEAFPRSELLKGRWPRGREVPEAQAEAEVAAAGILENGWLVRVFADGKPGYTLVINQDGDRLAVSGIDI
jgi:hypothetical protein